MRKRYYFDYAASTPVDPKALKAMAPYFSEKFGNPGSLHFYGQEAMSAVDAAREILAGEIGKNGDIIFTSSATEANNLAIKGAVLKAAKSPRFAKPKILVSAIEHESVHGAAKAMEYLGAEVVYLPVDKEGIVDLRRLRKELNERTVLVSVMLGNNETGTLEPIAEISKIISEFKQQRASLGFGAAPRPSGQGAEGGEASEGEAPANARAGSMSGSRNRGASPYPIMHSDAAQAFPYVRTKADELGVDMLTVSSQKIYGPKGAGALYVRNRKILAPLISGGSQEYDLRSGTENVPAIVGFGEAVKIAGKMRAEEGVRLGELRAYLWERTKKAVSRVEINGAADGLPHIINIYFPGRSAEELLTRLDLAGFAASSGSACTARAMKPSHVILALGYDEKRAKSSLRISLGRSTNKKDVDKLINELKKFK